MCNLFIEYCTKINKNARIVWLQSKHLSAKVQMVMVLNPIEEND